jgi:crotonobetainyl-CoA:carnitine CoA-transferase CaiB-like acyl-CoA transferase
MASTGEPDGAPMKVGVALSDIITGLHAAIGILAALHAREKPAKGRWWMSRCWIARSLPHEPRTILLTSGKAPKQGNAHSTIVPYQAFEDADGYCVAVGNNRTVRAFLQNSRPWRMGEG